MKKIAVVSTLLILSASFVNAGPIEQACRKSDRSASAQTCSCIQKVANVTLSNADQRKVARFIKEPEKSQDMKRSDTRRDEAFWERFEGFTANVSRQCG